MSGTSNSKVITGLAVVVAVMVVVAAAFLIINGKEDTGGTYEITSEQFLEGGGGSHVSVKTESGIRTVTLEKNSVYIIKGADGSSEPINIGSDIRIVGNGSTIDGYIELDAGTPGKTPSNMPDYRVTIEDVVFNSPTDNSGGMAIHAFNGGEAGSNYDNVKPVHLSVIGCAFSGYEVASIAVTNAQTLTVDDCTFGDSKKDTATAISVVLCGVQDSELSIRDSTFNGKAEPGLGAINVSQRGTASGTDDSSDDIYMVHSSATIKSLDISGCGFDVTPSNDGSKHYDIRIGLGYTEELGPRTYTKAFPVSIGDCSALSLSFMNERPWNLSLDLEEKTSLKCDGTIVPDEITGLSVANLSIHVDGDIHLGDGDYPTQMDMDYLLKVNGSIDGRVAVLIFDDPVESNLQLSYHTTHLTDVTSGDNGFIIFVDPNYGAPVYSGEVVSGMLTGVIGGTLPRELNINGSFFFGGFIKPVNSIYVNPGSCLTILDGTLVEGEPGFSMILVDEGAILNLAETSKTYLLIEGKGTVNIRGEVEEAAVSSLLTRNDYAIIPSMGEYVMNKISPSAELQVDPSWTDVEVKGVFLYRDDGTLEDPSNNFRTDRGTYKACILVTYTGWTGTVHEDERLDFLWTIA